jgi:hypothetical protein
VAPRGPKEPPFARFGPRTPAEYTPGALPEPFFRQSRDGVLRSSQLLGDVQYFVLRGTYCSGAHTLPQGKSRLPSLRGQPMPREGAG